MLSSLVVFATVLPIAALAAPHTHSTSKRAVATLKVPIFIEKGDGTIVPVADLNKDLKKAGVAELPLFMEVSSDEQDAYNKVGVADKIIEKAIAKAGKEWADATRNNPLYPTEGESEQYATCYAGDAVAVPDAVRAFAGVVYTEQLNMFAYKYKTATQYLDSQDEDETEKFLSGGSDLWKKWKGSDESILILSSVGDGGDDIQESLIPVCP